MLKYHPYKSDKPDKKYYIITNDNKKVYFGSSNYSDLGPVPRSSFSRLFLEIRVLIFVFGQRGSCGMKELNPY